MPANQAGKGPQPRAYDTTEYAAGVERVFGKKKPWWEARDERTSRDDVGTADVIAAEPEESLTPYQVPLIPDATFGTRLELPHRDELVITLRRGPSGWCVPQDMRHVRHPWQMYVADIDSASEHYGAKEIAVVGLSSGTWVTVWASSPSEISYPPTP